jgi:hypothetical protein
MGERTKHTPGPWVVWEEHADVYAGEVDENRPGSIGGKGLLHIARCDDDVNEDKEWDEDAEGGISPEESRANARLIAAAPDMAEALQVALGNLEAEGLDEPAALARAALKKAGVMP